MSGTYFTLNQKYNNLRTQENFGGGGGGGGGGIYTAIGMVNITQYGASTALPDNTAFIQDAINAVAVGGTLYIPQGTFIILGSLTISTSLNIFGVGTIKAGGAMPYMLGLNASVDMFGGLTIDGNSLAVIGLRLLNTIVVRLNNVEIKSCTTGISSSVLSSINLTLVDCLITDMTGTGISYQSPVITPPAIPPTLDVNNTIFRDCNKGISDIFSSNIVVQGCIFDNIVFSISTGSVSATTNPFSYNIMNNQFTRITGSAILINLVNTANYNTTTISNNIFSSRVSSYTPIDTIGGTFSTFNYDSPVLGIFGIFTLNTQFIQNTIENMYIPETTSAILMRCGLLTASFNNIGIQSVITGTPGVFIKCLDTAPFQQPILFLDRNVFKTQAMELVGFPAIPIPPIPGGFVVPVLTSSPCASFFDINDYSSGVDYVIDNTYETYAFTETFANTIKLIVNQSPTRIQFTNTSTAIGSAVYPTKIVDLLFNADTPLNSFVACDGVSFPNSIQMRFAKSGTYEIVYNQETFTLTATRLEDVGIATFNAVISTASIDLTSPTFYNSIVNFTGTTASTIDLPPPITNTRNNIYLGTSIQIFNNTNQEQIIQTPANILGVYGSNATTIPLPENSWYKLVVDGSNWRINERSSNLTYPIPLSVNTDYSAYDYLVNATTRFAPTTALTATIPSPVSASGGSSAHTTMNIINNGDHVLTLLTTGIDFRGKYGRGGGGTNDSIPMPPHSSVVLYSNGTNWVANERSYNPTYFITLSTASTDASTFNYFSDATINISSTATTNNILVIPPPNRNEIDNATITFSNTSVYSITLSITAGTFAGKYGSGTTTLLIPPNASVQVLTDGTNWLVTDRSGDQTYYLNGNGIINDWSSNNQYLNSLVEFVASDSAINTNATFNITASITINSNLLVVTATAGIISVGSSITTGGRTYYIISQDYTGGGVAGGIGSYRLSGYFASAVASGTLIVKPSSNVVNSGTITITNSSANISTGNILTATGAGTIDAGAQLSVQNLPTRFCNTLERIGATGTTGTYYITAQNSANLTGQTYYSSSATTLLFPAPSTSNLGQTITIKNSSYAPVNITTSARSAIFSGKYSSSYVITSSTSDTAVVPAKNHLLLAQQQGVFRSDGTEWEVVEGTSFEGTRAFYVNASTTTSATDGTTQVVPFTPLYSNTSCLFGLVSNAGIGTGSYAVNMFPFPITIQVTFNCIWSNPTTGSVVNVIPQRRIGIQYNPTSSTANFYINSNIGSNSIIPQHTSTIAGASITYVLTATTIPHMVSGVITLNPGDQIAIITTKYNGVAGTEGLSGVVYFNRIA